MFDQIFGPMPKAGPMDKAQLNKLFDVFVGTEEGGATPGSVTRVNVLEVFAVATLSASASPGERKKFGFQLFGASPRLARAVPMPAQAVACWVAGRCRQLRRSPVRHGRLLWRLSECSQEGVLTNLCAGLVCRF